MATLKVSSYVNPQSLRAETVISYSVRDSFAVYAAFQMLSDLQNTESVLAFDSMYIDLRHSKSYNRSGTRAHITATAQLDAGSRGQYEFTLRLLVEYRLKTYRREKRDRALLLEQSSSQTLEEYSYFSSQG